MQEVDINTLVNNYNELNENIPENIIIVGKINNLKIKFIYNKLDLSKDLNWACIDSSRTVICPGKWLTVLLTFQPFAKTSCENSINNI